jgi:hypothetical protein
MKLEELIKNGATGLYYGNRIILPFHFHLLKVILDTDIITDFSPSARGIYVREEEEFTDIYFLDYKRLKEKVTQFEAIKMILVKKGDNIFNPDNQIKLNLYLKERHLVNIELTDEDILFIE